jgi:hypothetical protein
LIGWGSLRDRSAVLNEPARRVLPSSQIGAATQVLQIGLVEEIDTALLIGTLTTSLAVKSRSFEFSARSDAGDRRILWVKQCGAAEPADTSATLR